MALPTSSQIQTLDYKDWSLPVVYVDAKTGINSSTLDFTDWSLPVVGLSVSGGGGGDPANVIYIKTASDTWSTASNIYIKTASDTWTEVDDLYIKTDSGWNV
jgi:hypothetical protein|tara:strand:+ start:3808 stop:4113 length:306 start_codon:yes stop_codon:yes gene_type:complete